MSIYKNGKLIAGGRQCMPLLSFIWADHQLNDTSWLRADTFSWQSGAVYQAAYQHLTDDYSDAPYLTLKTRYDHGGQSDYIMYYRDPSNDTTSPGGALPALTPIYAWTTDNASAEYATLYSDRLDSFPALLYYISGSTLGSTANTTPLEWYKYRPEIVAGISINCCQTADGHKIVLADQESAVSAIYVATGVAWYYVLDTVNQRFKLPRTKFGFTGLRDTVGGYIEPELPNVVGEWNAVQTTNNTASGAFYYKGSAGGNTGTTHSGGDRAIVGFDASRSSSIYKGGATVQPSATQMYLYFYVGQFTQTALENTAGVVTEDFNELNAHKVIEFQEPTADNGYVWYRKYADGWVEQGGYSGLTVTVTNNSPSWSVSLPVEMADNNYTAIANASFGGGSAWNGPFKTSSSTTTTVNFSGWVSGTGNAQLQHWQVSGMAA